MGFYSGSVAITRYRLHHKGRPPSIAKLDELLQPYKAGPLKLQGATIEEALTWAPPPGAGVSESGSHWSLSECLVQGAFALRMQCDRRKVSAKLLQLVYRQTLEAREKDRGKRLPRSDRDRLKEKIKADLIAKTLPNLSTTDALWRPDDADLLLFSSSQGVRTQFESLFRECFAKPLKIEMLRISPPLLGMEDSFYARPDDDEWAPLVKTVPTPFVGTEATTS